MAIAQWSKHVMGGRENVNLTQIKDVTYINTLSTEIHGGGGIFSDSLFVLGDFVVVEVSFPARICRDIVSCYLDMNYGIVSYC